MTLGAHILAGLIIGKVTNNYPLAMAGSLLIDVDHLFPYIKHKLIFNPKKLWETVTRESDDYGNQRNYLHSLFTWAIVSAISFLIDFNVGGVISLAYLSHLFLDLIDGADFFPFYPLKYKFIGPIKYFSKAEIIFTLILAVVFFVLPS